MVLITSCCFSKSLRSGSMVSAVYTLIYYILTLTASSFQIHNVMNEKVLLIFTSILAAFSVTIIISSIIMMIGIYADNKRLLLPWIVTVSITTVTDIVFSLYLIIYMITDPFVAVIHCIDFVICVLNTYCLLCVISQYQIYSFEEHQSVDQNCEEPRMKCITNETDSTCQFSNSVNKEAANSTFE